MAKAEPWPRPNHGRAMAWPWQTQVLPIHGGRDSGRLDFSVRTWPDWPAKAATAAARIAGSWAPSYHFDEGVLTDADVTVTADSIAFAGQAIALNGEVPEGWQLD